MEPDLSFAALVHADEVLFGSRPEAEVTFHGEPCHASLSADDRHNLPDQVTPGTPYRDVLVRYALATSIAPPPEEAAEAETEAADRSTGPAQVPESCGTVASWDPVARR